jgi:hypothetical protein
MDILETKLIAAARAAIDDLTLVTALYTGTLTVENMNYIRRYATDENGTEYAHLWDKDPTMPVIQFVREGEKKDVILANWAAHCDTVMSSFPSAISADYVAPFREKAEEALDAHVAMHMGASGDVNPSSKLSNEPNFPGTIRYGQMLAEALIAGIPSLERCNIKSSVGAEFEKVKVEFDHSTDDKAAEAEEVMSLFDNGGGKLTAEVRALIEKYGFENIYDAMYVRIRSRAGVYERITVGAISIGNAVFAVAPYEMFSANGKAVKDSATEFDAAFMCACTNGKLSYIASEEAFKYDIYEVRSRRYVKETATVLQDAMIAAIDKLSQ